MMYALRPLAVASLLAATACGDPLATGGFKPAYFTIHGTIAGSTVATPADVHVALLWQNDQNPDANYVAQNGDVRASFPVSFDLAVTELPSPSVTHALKPDTAAMLGVDPEMRWAIGTLVVYADALPNQALDMVAPGGTSPDRILGAATGVDIIYLVAGNPAPVEWIGIFPTSRGLSIVREPERRDPEFGECGRFTAQGHLTELCEAKELGLPVAVDPATRIEVTLSGDDALQRFACRTFWGVNDYADWLRDEKSDICDGGLCKYCQGYQCPLDLPPAGVTPRCSPDGTAYVYKTCVYDDALCGTRFCHFGHGERAAADPPPADWPCP